MPFTIFSQFLILHATQDFDLRLSSPRQPGHGFRSLVNARHRRQFIPQGAISFIEIAVAFVDLFDVMIRSGRSYVSSSLLKPNYQNQRRRISRLMLDWQVRGHRSIVHSIKMNLEILIRIPRKLAARVCRRRFTAAEKKNGAWIYQANAADSIGTQWKFLVLIVIPYAPVVFRVLSSLL